MKALIIITITILIILGIFFLPLAFIWAINALFKLNLAYTFTNWLAAFVLMAIFGNKTPTISYNKNK
jgi:uncharacterized RDD family membrane protein YckC